MVAAQPFVEGTYGHGPEITNIKRTLEYSSGVESGMVPTQNAPAADMSVDITSGYFWIKGTRCTYAGGNQAIDAADATNPRWDIIYFQSDGIHYTAGTPSATPAMPALPAASIINCAVSVAATETEILDGDVRDERVLVNFGAPIGSIMAWGKSLTHCPALPANWHECDGSVLSDADSPFNGDTLPSLNTVQRFLRGSTTSGTTGGADTHALSIAELAAHTHTFSNGSSAGTTGALQGLGSTPRNTSSTGSGTAHNNMPAYYEVVWIIRIK